MIDAVDDRRIDVLLARRGDHDALRAAAQVRAGLGLAREQPGAFEHEVDAQLAPRQLRRVALGQHLDAIAVDDQRIAFHLHLAGELAVHAVVARQVRVGLRVAQVVERDDLDFLLAVRLVQRAQDIATDAAVAIDSDFDGHSLYLSTHSRSTAATTFSGVNPKCLNRSLATPEAPNEVMPTTAPRDPT